MLAAPKMSPVRHWTLPMRAWVRVLSTEVAPTTKSDAAMASLGSIPAT